MYPQHSLPQPLCLINERSLLGFTQQFPLRSQPLWNFRIMHLRVFLCHLPSLTPWPHHESIHGSLDMLRLATVHGFRRRHCYLLLMVFIAHNINWTSGSELGSRLTGITLRLPNGTSPYLLVWGGGKERYLESWEGGLRDCTHALSLLDETKWDGNLHARKRRKRRNGVKTKPIRSAKHLCFGLFLSWGTKAFLIFISFDCFMYICIVLFVV